MNIQQILEQDQRIVEIKQKYTELAKVKHQKILDISHIEADLIKLSGIYETITKEIISKLQGVPPVEQSPVPNEEPVEDPIAEENMDDGFVEVKEPTPVAPTAENTTPKEE